VRLHADGVRILVEEDEPVELADIGDITAALGEIRRHHQVNGNWILVPDSRTKLEQVTRAMDAARAAEFAYVIVAGGAQ